MFCSSGFICFDRIHEKPWAEDHWLNYKCCVVTDPSNMHTQPASGARQPASGARSWALCLKFPNSYMLCVQTAGSGETAQMCRHWLPIYSCSYRVGQQGTLKSKETTNSYVKCHLHTFVREDSLRPSIGQLTNLLPKYLPKQNSLRQIKWSTFKMRFFYWNITVW